MYNSQIRKKLIKVYLFFLLKTHEQVLMSNVKIFKE